MSKKREEPKRLMTLKMQETFGDLEGTFTEQDFDVKGIGGPGASLSKMALSKLENLLILDLLNLPQDVRELKRNIEATEHKVQGTNHRHGKGGPCPRRQVKNQLRAAKRAYHKRAVAHTKLPHVVGNAVNDEKSMACFQDVDENACPLFVALFGEWIAGFDPSHALKSAGRSIPARKLIQLVSGGITSDIQQNERGKHFQPTHQSHRYSKTDYTRASTPPVPATFIAGPAHKADEDIIENKRSASIAPTRPFAFAIAIASTEHAFRKSMFVRPKLAARIVRDDWNSRMLQL
ncbi:hypothetical protein PsorP6_016422 [Peronosclerospora sorghi]|uniref:Uncharacterized protein n=1 Tax=Peronosclerospora sorghi TaxID=230839 RepID=A0ACC0VP32_9STRA|nr:hypothetical protein PsorP6_016422 [Peronosclerospora sorghi]